MIKATPLSRTCLHTLLLGAALAAGPAACAIDTESTSEPAASESAPSPGGKADSAFGDQSSDPWAAIAARCTAPTEDEEVVYGNDFRWDYTREDMAARSVEIYESGKRLFERARFDEETGSFILPSIEEWGGQVVLPKRLVENVTAHLEQALELGYADHVFFPDMGHSHFFIPQAHWDAHYAGTPTNQITSMLGRLLDDPQLLVLYHTAEQLQMLDENDELLPDEYLQWRHQTRNVVGDNDWQDHMELLQNPDSPANTARDYPGHNYYGAGFNVSASKDGCFPYFDHGELKWYDLSLSDLPYKSDGGGGDYM